MTMRSPSTRTSRLRFSSLGGVSRGLECKVQGLGFRVQGLGFRVQGSGFKGFGGESGL